MYKIGEFSKIAKTSIKTLRYYESEGLLIPKKIDEFTGYRYYDSSQLIELGKIISLRQLGISINDIKSVLNGTDMSLILNEKRKELNNLLKLSNEQLSRIDYLLEGNDMNYEVIKKELPDYTVYYKEGVVKEFSDLSDFILTSGKECLELNPDIKCIEPDYCFVTYLDGEYKENNIKVRYSQAVTKSGIENDSIKFEKLTPIEAVCVYHKGSYEGLRNAYNFLINWIEKNGYEMSNYPRERYIDGIWNQSDSSLWLTEIQIPIKKK